MKLTSPNFNNSEDYLVLALSSLDPVNLTEENGGLNEQPIDRKF